MYGKSEDRNDYQYIDRPVGGMARDLPDHLMIDFHRHPRGQLIYAYAGAISVVTEAGSWVVPPQRAVWLPPDTLHAMQAFGNAQLRTLYIRADAARHLPAQCCVIAVPPLLRELILAAVQMPIDYDEQGRDGLVIALLLREMQPLDVVALHLPMPTDRRLEKICREIIEDPANDMSLDAWGRRVGASERTLIRLFPEQTGMTFTRWRQQARLLAAIQLLATQHSVTDVALRLSYDSPSAFSAMFRKALGFPPSDYFGEHSGDAGHTATS